VKSGVLAMGTLIWLLLWGAFDLTGMVMGLALSALVSYAVPPKAGPDLKHFLRKLPKIISLFLFFLWELLLANLRLAWDAVTPGLDISPSIIALPLDAKTDSEIFLLTMLITLTPGTLSMEVTEDRSHLFVHCAYAGESTIADLKKSLKDGFERRVLEVMR